MDTTLSFTTAEQIADFISQHPTEELITRRHLIKFGSANIVDGIIFKLIHKTGALIRVAWGCYRKRERAAKVSANEVAQVKSAAYGRTIVASPREAAFNLGICSAPPTSLEFLTNGRTSSFKFENSEIIFKGASPRKMALGDTKVAKVVRALWYLGKSKVDQHVIGTATKSLHVSDRIELGKLCASMPGWLADYLQPWRLLEEVSIPQTKSSNHGQVRETVALYIVNQSGTNVRGRTIALRR